MSDLKINIYGRNNNNNTITDKEYPKFEDAANRLKSTSSAFASKSVSIVFESSAVGTLFKDIGWGRGYKRGDVEQAGMLIGNYYCDASSEMPLIWGDVVVVIPADPLLVTATSEAVNITASAWKKMYEQAVEYHAENLQILGWYHTHLRHINTSFSSVDIRTQHNAFTYEYSFGVVFNPNQKKWSVFHGSDSKECAGELIFDNTLEMKYGEPKIKIRQVSGDSQLQEDGTVDLFGEDGHVIGTKVIVQNAQTTRVLLNYTRDFFQNLKCRIGGMFRIGHQCQKRKSEVRTSATVLSNSPHSNERKDTKKNKSKIIAGKTNKENPTIRYQFFLWSSDNNLIEQPDLGYGIKENDIKTIIYAYQQPRKPDLMWGNLNGTVSNMDLIEVSPSQSRANAKIMFSQVDINLIRTVFSQATPPIEYTILIDTSNQQEIEVCIIQYCR